MTTNTEWAVRDLREREKRVQIRTNVGELVTPQIEKIWGEWVEEAHALLTSVAIRYDTYPTAVRKKLDTMEQISATTEMIYDMYGQVPNLRLRMSLHDHPVLELGPNCQNGASLSIQRNGAWTFAAVLEFLLEHFAPTYGDHRCDDPLELLDLLGKLLGRLRKRVGEAFSKHFDRLSPEQQRDVQRFEVRSCALADAHEALRKISRRCREYRGASKTLAGIRECAEEPLRWPNHDGEASKLADIYGFQAW